MRFSVLLLSACFDFGASHIAGKDTAGAGAVSLVTSTPADDATDVAVDTVLSLAFSGAIDPARFSATLTPGITLAPALFASGNQLVSLTPSATLAIHTTYTLNFSAGDVAGAITFTTAEVAAFPTLVKTTPADASSAVDPTAPTVLDFSVAMAPQSVTVTCTPAHDFGVAAWSNDNTRVTYSARFADATGYSCVVDGNAANTKALGGKKTFAFTTLDVTPPTLVAHSPSGSLIPKETPVRLTFSEPMNRQATQDALSYVLNLSAPWSATGYTWSEGDTVLTFSPAPLGSCFELAVTIGAAAKDAHGIAVAAPVTFAYHTAARGSATIYCASTDTLRMDSCAVYSSTNPTAGTTMWTGRSALTSPSNSNGELRSQMTFSFAPIVPTGASIHAAQLRLTSYGPNGNPVGTYGPLHMVSFPYTPGAAAECLDVGESDWDWIVDVPGSSGQQFDVTDKVARDQLLRAERNGRVQFRQLFPGAVGQSAAGYAQIYGAHGPTASRATLYVDYDAVCE